jgi:hypothetical protein
VNKRIKSTTRDYYPTVVEARAPDPDRAKLSELQEWLRFSPDGLLPGQVAVYESIETNAVDRHKVLPSTREQRPSEATTLIVFHEHEHRHQ